MTAEQIVRALAARGPVAEVITAADEHRHCTLCHVERGPAVPLDDFNHQPDCPWRLAVEWVAAHPLREGVCAAYGETRSCPDVDACRGGCVRERQRPRP